MTMTLTWRLSAMVKAADVLVDCPRNCGHKVKASKHGDPHQASKTVDGEIVIYTCE